MIRTTTLTKTRTLGVAFVAALFTLAANADRAFAAPCLADAAGDPGLRCTANDFGVSTILVDTILDGCTDYGDTFTFNGRFGIAGGSPSRYDIGLYAGNDGEQAYNGQCSVSILPSNFPNLDGDICRDYNGSAMLVPVTNITTVCTDSDGDGFFDVPICTSWDNNTMPDCNGPADAVPSTKSKCACSQVNTNLAAPHCETNADCPSDNNTCTTEVCNPIGSGLGNDFGCSSNNNTLTCNDGLFCTVGDTCGGGTCNGTPRNCSDGNVCTNDTCNETTDTCVNTNNTLPCNDGLFCNGADTCSGGSCSVHAGDPCAGGPVCGDNCNETADNCFDPAGTPCRSSAGVCDVAESCTGTSGACPANGFLGTGTICRASAGVCDSAERCSGSAAACPADSFAATSTTCRASAGVCDVAETCSGTSVSCPADVLASTGTTCRSSVGSCDVAETCTGTGAACPANVFVTGGTTCRASAGVCDVAETCSGTSGTCPANAFSSTATTCRASAGVCDVAETCSGTGATCPADGFASTGTTCRASASVCDAAETCSGTGAACPVDAFSSSSTVCRASAGSCDVAETCTGTSGSCPANALAPSTTVCRASAGVCDVAETCTGTSGACPANVFLTSTTTCRGSAGICDVTETCNGSSASCPSDVFLTSTTTCRGSNGICDQVEVCSGSAPSCPADAFLSTGTTCRSASGVCDAAEVCSGTAASCPANGFAATSVVCRPSTGTCDAAENCSGTSGACPADGFATTATVCRAADGDCDVAENCTGTSGSCPANGFAGTATVCRASIGTCDVAETCTGSGNNCPVDGFAPSNTVCRTAVGVCDETETCTGTSNSCPGDAVAMAGEVCRASAGSCDTQETCNGSDADCPPDGFVNEGTLCRISGGVCDQAESCTGSAAACPDDEQVAAGTVCRESAGDCDVAETCDGSSDTCPADTLKAEGSLCTNDGDVCTDDVCDGAGVCQHPFNTAPCDDGLYCTDVDLCDAGNCVGATRNCSDGNVCTDDSCDEGLDTCVHDPNTDPCDDMLFCNGDDTCSGGVCLHAGNPCPGADGDIDCTETCDEAADDCEGNDANGSACNDGLFCTAVDTCLAGTCVGAARDCSDDSVCTTDSCDDMIDMCVNTPLPNGTPCDDEYLCTIGDQCTAGICSGEETSLLDLCPWIVVERQHPKKDQLKVGLDAGIGGDVCGSTVKVGRLTVVDGGVGSSWDSGVRGIRLAPDTLIVEDIASMGGGAKARPSNAKLPHTGETASVLSPGTVFPKADMAGSYLLNGTSQLAFDCVAARNSYDDVQALLDAKMGTQFLSPIKLPANGVTTITANNPGGINIIDVLVVKTGRDATVTIDGGGNPNTIVVLRIQKKLQMRLRSDIVLTGGLLPENMLFYVTGPGKVGKRRPGGKCQFGDFMTGGGTVFCSTGRLKTGKDVVWTGTLYGAGRVSRVGDTNMLTYQPFLADLTP